MLKYMSLAALAALIFTASPVLAAESNTQDEAVAYASEGDAKGMAKEKMAKDKKAAKEPAKKMMKKKEAKKEEMKDETAHHHNHPHHHHHHKFKPHAHANYYQDEQR